MKCPRCGFKLHFGRQIQIWDDEFGEDVYLDDEGVFPCFINIFCDHCKLPTVSVYVESGGLQIGSEIKELEEKRLQAVVKERKKKMN